MDNTNMAWCAGLFEGEGNIHLTTQYGLTVTVVNNQKELLEPFLEFGGSTKPHGGKSYRWRIGGNNIVERFVLSLLPHIKSTRNQALFNLAIEFVVTNKEDARYPMHARNHDKYERYRLRFKELHHLT